MKASLIIVGVVEDDLEELREIFSDHEITMDSISPGEMKRRSFKAYIDLGGRSIEKSKAILADLVDKGSFVSEDNLKNLRLPLEALELSTRARKAIAKKDPSLSLVGHLTAFTYAEMLKGLNVGPKTASEIRAELNKRGLDFGMKIDGFHKEWKS